jgi:hypothetical protein
MVDHTGVRHNFLSAARLSDTNTKKNTFTMVRLHVLLNLLVAIVATLSTAAFAPVPAFSKTVGALKSSSDLLKEKQHLAPTRFFGQRWSAREPSCFCSHHSNINHLLSVMVEKELRSLLTSFTPQLICMCVS